MIYPDVRQESNLTDQGTGYKVHGEKHLYYYILSLPPWTLNRSLRHHVRFSGWVFSMTKNSGMLPILIKSSKQLGFIAIGFSRPGRPLYFDRFLKWLSDRKYADMAWFERRIALREDPSRILEGCETIISLAYPYPFKRPTTPDGFYVSRYSTPSVLDYHDRLKKLCGSLLEVIKDRYRGSLHRICVDSAPVLERGLAFTSGIGFFGKNNMLIIPGYGSYFYLAEIFSTAPLEFPHVTPMQNQCGSCTLCVDACPTGALEKPFSLDASRCLSYLSIEYKGELPGTLAPKMGRCFFGCDRCQEACPFNGGDASTETSLPVTEVFLNMKKEEFREKYGKTALGRAGLEKLKANIRAARASG
jgi:epoxyqueuosine reductase